NVRLDHRRRRVLVRADGADIAVDGTARPRDRLVPAAVLGFHAGADDPADFLVRRELLDGAQHLLAAAGGAGVDHENAVLADLHGDVGARADDHVHVALYVHGLDLASRQLLRLIFG